MSSDRLGAERVSCGVPAFPMRHARSALVLLVALVGGLSASSVHTVVHGSERAASRTEHLADGRHGSPEAGGLARVPCADGPVHETPCAVCQGFGGAVIEEGRLGDAPPATESVADVAEAHAVWRRALSPARGPPSVV